jgi:hypothetical protein
MGASRRRPIVVPGVFKSNRVEFIAIPLMLVLLGGLFLIFAVSQIGAWAWVLTGVVFTAAIFFLLWLGGRRQEHGPARDAPRPAEHRPPGPHRVLVVIDETCPVKAIRAAVAGRTGGRPAEAFVVAPAAGSGLDRLMGDEAGYEGAGRHLELTLHELETIDHLDVRRGTVGSHDPIQAADDGLREFPADEILFGFPGTVDLARKRYGIPVTQLAAAAAERP